MANVENSILRLHEHQQEAYENVEELFKNGRYAAVIFPTGCGKSFVTLEYILKHPDARILFLSPRNAIKEQMYEYIVRYIGGVDLSVEEIQKQYGSMKNAAKTFIPNIECMLYQTILSIGEKENLDEVLDKLNPDLIVVDEMHHLKTKRNDVILDDEENESSENEWGRKFGELLERFPEAKVLGLSATPIRNDNVNVVERLFKSSVASEISLLEAMEEGIIIPPKYVTPDFVRPDELETLLEQIEKAKEPQKTQLKEKYDELVKMSTKAKGIPELLSEHITKKDGKYIIFCKNIEDMEQKAKEAKEWFKNIDEEPEIYKVSSKHKDSQEQLNSFNSSNSEHVKLLYCVGMIDEGVHLNGVSGVILTARTESRPVYLQRLGRAISSGDDKEQALVIDLVNNNEILFNEKNNGEEQQYEVRDIELLRAAIEWIEEKNEGELPQDEEGKSLKERALARRLQRIKNKYIKYFDNPKLLEEITSKEQREEIEAIIDEAVDIELWTTDLVISNYNKETDDNINSFLNDIEIKGYRRDFREILREARGTDIPVMLQNVRKIRNWMAGRKTTKPPSATGKDEEERKLGRALSNIRKRLIKPYNEAKTEEEKAKILERSNLTQEQFEEIVGIVEEIDINNIPTRLQNVREIRNWMAGRKTTKPPSATGKDEEERKLGRALSDIRQRLIKLYKKAKTEEEKAKILERSNLTQEQFEEIVKIVEEIDRNNIPVYLQNVREIQKWMTERKITKPPSQTGKEEEEKRLGQALSNIRENLIKLYNKAKNEEEKAKILERSNLTQEQFEEIVGIVEEIDINNIPTMLINAREIRDWMKNQETTRPPRGGGKDLSEEERKLGRVLSAIRQRLIKLYKEAKTEAEKAKILERSGLEQEQFDEIVKIVDEIDRNNIPIMLIHARKIRDWMEDQRTTKPPSQKGKDETEKRLGEALSYIRLKLIKPYNKLETEEERGKFLERKRLTQEQFDEIMKIIEEVDKDKDDIPIMVKRAREIRTWMEEQGITKTPRANGGKNLGETEKRLGQALRRIRKKLIEPYNEAKTEEEKAKILERSNLTQEQFDEIISIVEEIDRNNPKRKRLQEAKATRDEAKGLQAEAKKLEEQVEGLLSKKKGKTHE